MIVLFVNVCLCVSLYVSLIWKRREVRILVDAYLRMNYRNGSAKESGGYGYEQRYEYINRHRDIGVH